MRKVLGHLPMLLLFGWMGWRVMPRSMPQPAALELTPEPVAKSVEGLDANAILARLAQAYSDVSAYRDEFWARSVKIEDGDRDLWSVEHARVALERPDQLLWQWREYRPRRHSRQRRAYLLQSDGRVQVETEHWELTELEDRSAALGRIHDSRDLLQFLFPGELSGRSLLERLSVPRVTAIERFRGRECHKVEASWRIEDREPVLYVLWIDRETGLLLRMFERSSIADWYLERTVAFMPEGAPALDASDFTRDGSF